MPSVISTVKVLFASRPLSTSAEETRVMLAFCLSLMFSIRASSFSILLFISAIVEAVFLSSAFHAPRIWDRAEHSCPLLFPRPAAQEDRESSGFTQEFLRHGRYALSRLGSALCLEQAPLKYKRAECSQKLCSALLIVFVLCC